VSVVYYITLYIVKNAMHYPRIKHSQHTILDVCQFIFVSV